MHKDWIVENESQMKVRVELVPQFFLFFYLFASHLQRQEICSEYTWIFLAQFQLCNLCLEDKIFYAIQNIANVLQI